MAATSVRGAAEELASALAALAVPILDAEAVLRACSKITFRSRAVEREMAVAISNVSVELRQAAREERKAVESILSGARELHARMLALASQEEEEHADDGKIERS